ncbi:CarD family transcriptional regulator [Rhodovastum atsumiense]|uniref:CarD family transcriptional regulator n=1 Tax=Rhodovastum atsumiense TaxID=504468 RepID=A0A5M6IKU7_9PROT|nr:CarD family transcriptional regulator [Rhodovastum atsumiense]KAA5608489.1 CarD family transcriptional regulator [Rhodovastum atsumiense]CAH2599295.1 CarD family transcriptional regulator [Rhodovastum atsumiense]
MKSEAVSHAAPVAAARPDQARLPFVPGQRVVYPAHGVGTVSDITTETVAGECLELIHITFDESRMTLRVPVTKAAKSGLRALASRETLQQAIAVVTGKPKIIRGMWSRKAKDFADKIGTGDPIALAEVARDTRKGGESDQSFSERRVYELALDRLASELAAVHGIDKAAALAKLMPLPAAA